MTAGLEIRNDDGYLLLDRKYNNLYLSRKVKASSLPIETFGNGDGTWVMGNFRGRRITMNAGEVLVAAGRSAGNPCPYVINYGVVGASGNVSVQPMLFAAERMCVNIENVIGNAYLFWDDDFFCKDTGISDGAAVADDLYVYFFARTPNTLLSDNVGLQIRNGDNELLYDSSAKSARVLYAGNEWLDDVPSNRKVAFAPCGILAGGRSGLGHGSYFYCGGVGSYINDYGDISTGGGVKRCATTGGLWAWRMEQPNYLVLDVTNY